MDLYNSLPFYSELGEKIISNEVRPSGESSSSVIDKELVKAIREYPENVVITKNTMNGPKVYKLGEIEGDNGYTITWNVPDPYGEGWHENRAGSLSITPSTGRVETGYNALDDNFLTISVTVPVEIVEKLDPKFVTTIFYHGDDEYLYKDEACTQKITFDELDAVKTTPIVISTYGEHENTHFCVTAVRMDKDNGVGQVVYVIPEDAGWLGGSRSLYTEEYEGNIGPM